MGTQFDEYIRDYSAVVRRDKPMMVCEKRKSPSAYSAIRTATSLAGNPDSHDLLLANERGHRRDAIIVSYSTQRIEGLLVLLQHRNAYSREDFQLHVGRLLGYSDESCANFSHSVIGRSCECELCGGVPAFSVVRTTTAESRAKKRQLHDEHVRRTMYHAK